MDSLDKVTIALTQNLQWTVMQVSPLPSGQTSINTNFVL